MLETMNYLEDNCFLESVRGEGLFQVNCFNSKLCNLLTTRHAHNIVNTAIVRTFHNIEIA